MKERWKNAILGAAVFGIIGIAVTAILDGTPVWNLVIGQAIAGFLLYMYIIPAMQKRTERISNR